MTRPSRYEWRVAKLQCNRCGHRYQGRVMHVSIETVDRGSYLGAICARVVDRPCRPAVTMYTRPTRRGGDEMRGTFEELREQNPGKWLLIRLDGPEAEAGTLLAAHENSDVVEDEMDKRFDLESSRVRPLYITFAVREGQAQPVFAL